MRYCQLSILCMLTAAPLHNLTASPLAPHWDHLRIKHSGTIYGEHLSKGQVNRLIAPHQDTLDLVHSWLEYHNIPSSSISMTRGGSLLTLAGVPVSRANGLLGASYQLYKHTGTNDTAILRTVGYSLPTVLHAHVQTVIPTTYFSTRTSSETSLKHYVNSTSTTESREVVRMPDPASLRDLYRTINYVPAASDKNVLAITAFMNQNPSLDDFDDFMTLCRSDAVNPLEAVYHVEEPSPEANANLQYTDALVYPTPILFYSAGGDLKMTPGTNEPAQGDFFLEWLIFVLDQENVPETITISFGAFENYLPLDMERPYATENCIDSSGRLRFLVQFPSSCPWVTSVGGTTNQIFRAEEAAVKTYLDILGGQYHNGWYNPSGRGIPDISAQAINYYVIHEGQLLSHPAQTAQHRQVQTAASIISLLNDYRNSTGRKPLGFLNPWLYGHGRKALYDVASGTNPGCGTNGFPATSGWDPVTGLGTPDFMLLQYTLDYIPVN
ncbi:peptidase S8/S53 domain-containing protein [Lactarius quietus]|nr:peptidase S8/S53 domain-containing protein [Lactarius quietus]